MCDAKQGIIYPTRGVQPRSFQDTPKIRRPSGGVQTLGLVQCGSLYAADIS